MKLLNRKATRQYLLSIIQEIVKTRRPGWRCCRIGQDVLDYLERQIFNDIEAYSQSIPLTIIVPENMPILIYGNRVLRLLKDEMKKNANIKSIVFNKSILHNFNAHIIAIAMKIIEKHPSCGKTLNLD